MKESTVDEIVRGELRRRLIQAQKEIEFGLLFTEEELNKPGQDRILIVFKKARNLLKISDWERDVILSLMTYPNTNIYDIS